MEIIIRKASTSDLARIQSIAKHIIDKDYRSFLDDYDVDWYLSGPSDEYLTQHLDTTIVLCVNGVVTGFSVCKKNYIELIMIEHEAQRTGLGSKLLSYCERFLFNDYKEIKIESFENNVKAKAFYLKNGWNESGIEYDVVTSRNKYILTKKKE
jgi:ribosomal protein S18 acetylase RimI-like enzyme